MGSDGLWARDRLTEYGVDTRHIAEVDVPTGHAIIAVDAQGENLIVLYQGANHAISNDQLGQALSSAVSGDLLVMQNETNAQIEAAKLGCEMGLTVCYAAAPFQADAVQAVLPYLDFLILNEVEAEQLQDATGLAPSDLPVEHVIVTFGSKGARYYQRGHKPQAFRAHKVNAVDTNGAGDIYAGACLAAWAQDAEPARAARFGNYAAAQLVQRYGARLPSIGEYAHLARQFGD